MSTLNPIALRKAKIAFNFGLSECSRVKGKNLLIWRQFLSLRVVCILEGLGVRVYPYTFEFIGAELFMYVKIKTFCSLLHLSICTIFKTSSDHLNCMM